MSIGITAYRTLSVLVLAALVAAVALASLGRWVEAGIVITQAVLLRCQHCGTRPGLWLLAIWTLLLGPEWYIADALFLRRCPRCEKSLSEAKIPSV